jgi:hypothetical protein
LHYTTSTQEYHPTKSIQLKSHVLLPLGITIASDYCMRGQGIDPGEECRQISSARSLWFAALAGSANVFPWPFVRPPHSLKNEGEKKWV